MRPVAFVVCWAVFAQLVSMNEVWGLTNAEFYDLIKDYVTDVEVLDSESVGIDDYLQDDKDVVINLPGGPDDEIDLEDIANKLGLIDDVNNVEDIHFETDGIGDYSQDDNDEDIHLPGGPDDEIDVDHIKDEQVGNKADAIGDSLQDGSEELTYLPGRTDGELDAEYIEDQRSSTSNDEVDFGRNRHGRHPKRRLNRDPRRRQRNSRLLNRGQRNLRRVRLSLGCHCHRDSCSCCLKHTFRVNLIFKKLRFRLHACVTVAYLRRNIGFEITFTINRHRLFHKEISLRNPPPLCFGVPGLRYFARVCLQFYNINLRTKRVCARLVGILDLWIKKFRVHLKLGCFKIPILDEQALTNLLNDENFLSAFIQDSGADGKAVDLGYLLTNFQQLQDDQGGEDSNKF